MLPKNIKRCFFQNQYRCATCWHRLRRKLAHLRVWAQQIGRRMCLSSKKNVKNTCEKTWSFWFGRVVFVKWAMVRPHGPLHRHFVNTTHTKLQKIIKKTKKLCFCLLLWVRHMKTSRLSCLDHHFCAQIAQCVWKPEVRKFQVSFN